MEKRQPPIHPASIIIVLVIAGLTMLFIAISFAFIYARVTKGVKPVEVPLVFLLNVGVLLLASYVLEKARHAMFSPFQQRPLNKLYIVLTLTLLFLGLQIFGWYSLFQQDYFVNKTPGFAYLYALSGLHLLHVVGGLPFLVLFIFNVRKQLQNAPSRQGDFTFGDATHRRLRLISRYWHFVDLLWVYLVAFLLVNRMF